MFSTLRKLILTNTSITGVGVRHLVDALASSLQPNNVTVLVLDNNPVSPIVHLRVLELAYQLTCVQTAGSRWSSIPLHGHPTVQALAGTYMLVASHDSHHSGLRMADAQGQQVRSW